MQTCPSVIFKFPNRQIEEYQKERKLNGVMQKKSTKNHEFMQCSNYVCLEQNKR